MPCDAGIENLCLDATDGHWWSVPFQTLIVLYCFLGLGRVADSYLVTSLETLCVRLNVREDVAGASFMAFGSAAPEIIVNAVATIKAVYTESESGNDTNLGVGAIIGSGMIAFTLIPGACAVASSSPLYLKRRPLLRDLVFYSAALFQLIYCIRDGVVTGMEASMMLVLYGIYITVVVWSGHVRMLYRTQVLGLAPTAQASFVQGAAADADGTPEPIPPAEGAGADVSTPSLRLSEEAAANTAGVAVLSGPMYAVGFGEVPLHASVAPPIRASLASGADWVTGEIRNEEAVWERTPVQVTSVESVGSAETESDDDRTWTVAMPLEIDQQSLVRGRRSGRSSRGGRRIPTLGDWRAAEFDLRHHVTTHGLRFIEWLAGPLDALFAGTCPECAHNGPRAHWYPLTFVISFVWVSLFSMVISSIVGHWGELSGVPPSFLGLAVIAIGAEVPDCIQSVTVARRGYGSMAVSNSFGSQIINILIGLGMPWTISNAAGKSIHVGDVWHIRMMGALQGCNVLALFAVLLGVALVCGQNKAVLNRTKGAVLLVIYIACLVTYAIILFSPGTNGRLDSEAAGAEAIGRPGGAAALPHEPAPSGPGAANWPET
jgi:K+-dependent Na+/Ca+ exchanger-like protein